MAERGVFKSESFDEPTTDDEEKEKKRKVSEYNKAYYQRKKYAPAPKPVPQTRAEIQKRYRERVKQRQSVEQSQPPVTPAHVLKKRAEIQKRYRERVKQRKSIDQPPARVPLTRAEIQKRYRERVKQRPSVEHYSQETRALHPPIDQNIDIVEVKIEEYQQIDLECNYDGLKEEGNEFKIEEEEMWEMNNDEGLKQEGSEFDTEERLEVNEDEEDVKPFITVFLPPYEEDNDDGEKGEHKTFSNGIR